MNTVVDINTEELKASAPIIPYIKTFYRDKITITKENNNVAFASCIFHDEDTASLAFYANGTYKCFGCGEHGDLITLVQKIENVDFHSACEIIANNVGYKLNYVQVNENWEKYKDELDKHTRRYWANLQNNVEALNYLINTRKISPEIINIFRLGFTDQNEYRYRKDMENISSKLVFPILEHRRINPKCIGMAYRSLRDEKPKYINDHNQTGSSNQDPNLSGVFIKGNTLYGLAQSYKGISTNNFIIVTEGYFDVISMHQSGFTNTVGIMGTSFTKEQINTIKRLTDNVILMLDNDVAGITSMKKAIIELMKVGIRPLIFMNNKYKDPDEMCKAFEHDHYKILSFIKCNLIDGIGYVIHDIIYNHKETIVKERIKAFTEASKIISLIQDSYQKEAYTIELKKELY